MEIILDFKDKAEAELILNDMNSKGAVLVEVQNHHDGNHLVFNVTERNLVTEIDELKAKITLLESKVVI